MTMLRTNARYEMFWDEYFDGDEIPSSADVSVQVQKLIANEERQRQRILELQKELKEIKMRRGWDEISMTTDEKTGMTAIIRTYYSWRAETMRLDVTPDMIHSIYGY